MAKTFVISDDSVNRYGFRIRTSGIQLGNFLKNPIMLYMHRKGGERLPIGKWENLRFEGNRLLGDPVFDENDSFAQQIASKVAQGIINAVSPGLEMLDFSYEETDILPGQTGPTVTLADLQEVSFVDIPGNANAIRLCNNKQTITLGYDEDQAEALNQFFPENPTLKMKRIYLALGLQEGSSEDLAMKAIEKLQQEKKDAEVQLAAKADEAVKLAADQQALQKKLADMEAAAKQKAAEDLVTLAFDKGKISGKEKESFLKLALLGEEGYSQVKEIIEDRKEYTPVTAQLAAAQGKAAAEDRSKWSFEDYTKKASAELADMRTNNWEQYAELFEKQYGSKPKKA